MLVVREVYNTHRDSTFSLLKEILEELGVLGNSPKEKRTKAIPKESPFKPTFPNGSKIKYARYKELLERLRRPYLSLHFILSTNPVGTEKRVYTRFSQAYR